MKFILLFYYKKNKYIYSIISPPSTGPQITVTAISILYTIKTAVEQRKKKNSFMFPFPMHFPVHGQWWSYPLIQILQSEQ